MDEDRSINDVDTAGIDELRARLAEAEETLRAIRHGEVDALLIADTSGERVYTLRSADAPYRALVEQMQEGAVTLNVKGDIIYANRSFADLVDAPLEQVIGSSIDRFIEEADQATLKALILEGAGTLRTRLHSGSRAPLDAHVSVSHMTMDDTEHRTLIVTDMSTLAKVQRESQSKDEFLAMLAHELRNPLAPIRTGLQVLRLSPGEEAVERVHEMMERQLSQMVRLIDDLLDVSRVSRGKIGLKKELIDLKTVIGLAVETSLPLIEAGRHDLALRIPPEPLPVEADPTRLAQVFSNLLNNAAKYTPDGGRLQVTALRDQNQVHVRVQDNGVGIAREMLPEVFEMFSQVGRNLDRAQGGLGIGLTLVRRLTEMHGGSVKAESLGTGTGSTFTVRLPLARARPTMARRKSNRDPMPIEPAKQGLRVLVVDDNLDGADMLSTLIEMHGHETELAYNGPEALEKLAAFEPQVVFLDIGLPGLDGYEVARRMRAQECGRRATLVSLTGWGSNDDKKRSREAGFDLHLTKPVNAVEIERLLKRVASSAPGNLDSAAL
jgi:PAS domain S-box-containing protein